MSEAGFGGSDRHVLSPRDFREVPVTQVGHPLADRVGEVGDAARGGWSWVATETRARTVFLNAMRLNFLATAIRDQRWPVLISDELTRLTPSFARVWRLAGGQWVVREAQNGLRDGFDGRQLDQIEDVWRLAPPRSVDEISVNYLRPVPADALQFTVIITQRHPARESAVLGGGAELVARAITNAPPRAWGVQEPAGNPWRRDDLTATIREQMPDEASVYLAGPGLTGSVGGRRTDHGVEEIIHLTLAVASPTNAHTAALRSALGAALRRLAEIGMPLVAVAMARPGPADLLVRPQLVPTPIPMSLLVGPPAVRGLRLDPERMRAQFGAQIVGRPRIPALSFDMGPLEPQAWARLDALLGSFEPDLLAEALGVGAEALRSAQLERSDHARATEETGHAES